MPDGARRCPTRRGRARARPDARPSTSWSARSRGAPPNQVELAMYSLLWSEHCAYKHSKKLLRTLPTEGEHVVMGPGENAGAVDVGGGLVCAFKVESHNHPSAVEPFQGAATGVGGILRDIFAIGARPIAVLDSLRFGEPDGERPRVRATCSTAPSSGIGHYGNSIGVPTVGGEVYFEGPYEQNCLVNAMALGLARARAARAQRRRRARATCWCCSAPRPAATGSAARRCSPRPSSAARASGGQAPDRPGRRPVRGEEAARVLARAARARAARLAAGPRRRRPHLLGLGDGLQGRGRDRHRRRRACRCARPDMEPFEVMVSESQERMLCVVEPANVDAVLALCEKWEVGGAAIGTVTDTRRMRVLDGGELVGDMPVRALVDDCPLYDLAAAQARPRRSTPPPPATPRPRRDAAARRCSRCWRAPTSPRAGRCSSSTTRSCSRAPCAAPSRPTPPCSALARRRRAGGQHRLQRPPRRRRPLPRHDRGGARVRRQPRLRRRRAAGHDQQPQLRQPREAAHRLAADRVGARPRRRLPGAARRRSSAATSRSTTRAPTGPIYPTPVIGMVGRLPDARRAGRLGFARAGDPIALVGPFAPSLAAERAREAARRAAARRAARDRHRGRRAPRRRAVRDAVRAGALVERPRHRRGRPRGRAGRVLPGGRARRAASSSSCRARRRELRRRRPRAVRRGPRRLRRERRRAARSRALGERVPRAADRHGRRRGADDRSRGRRRRRGRRALLSARRSPSWPARTRALGELFA